MSKYKIWDKTSQVITPIGEVLTASEWIKRYPVANAVTTVVADGEVNGAYFGILSQMKKIAEEGGADFSEATTDEEILEVYEQWEYEQAHPEPEPQPEVLSDSTRMADALEDLVVLTELQSEEA